MLSSSGWSRSRDLANRDSWVRPASNSRHRLRNSSRCARGSRPKMRFAASRSVNSTAALSALEAWIGLSPASISTMSWTRKSFTTCAASTPSACSANTIANRARCQECSAEFSLRVRLASDDCRITDLSWSSSARNAICSPRRLVSCLLSTLWLRVRGVQLASPPSRRDRPVRTARRSTSRLCTTPHSSQAQVSIPCRSFGPIQPQSGQTPVLR